MYKINLNPKRKSGPRPRSIDSIRLEAKRDGDKFEEFRCSFFIAVFPDSKKIDYHYELRANPPYTSDELLIEIDRFIRRGNNRIEELENDHKVTFEGLRPAHPICKVFNQPSEISYLVDKLFEALKSTLKNTGIYGSLKDKVENETPLDPVAPKIHNLSELGELAKANTDAIGRRRRKTSNELILDAIDRAGDSIRSLDDTDFHFYLKTLARIRAMSRCPKMLEIRLLEVAECVAEIEVEEQELERQGCRFQCFKATKHLDFILRKTGVVK